MMKPTMQPNDKKVFRDSSISLAERFSGRLHGPEKPVITSSLKDNMEYMVVPALIWAYQFSDAVIQLKDYTFLWNLLAPSDLHSIRDSPLFQASWENYHRRREEIIKDCNPPDRESRLRRIDVWGKSR